ncbi:hypothetical protein ACFYNO_19065 [Kitasatospora sp. NPDC006697]|uniref:hypothetical protein n=1 Tax=Kitasatospora sp. NPDC006697 TaxID=3364020 RepID=UPI0036CF05FE
MSPRRSRPSLMTLTIYRPTANGGRDLLSSLTIQCSTFDLRITVPEWPDCRCLRCLASRLATG